MGLIHVYCGDGKGKTTAALGLAVRAAGADKNVIIVQFLKGGDSSELNSLRKISNITILRNKEDLGFLFNMNEQAKLKCCEMHNNNLLTALSQVNFNKCDMLILDEVTYAYEFNLVNKELIENLLENKPEHLELVITGRNPDSLFIDNADYISEINEKRHPYKNGVAARRGIEY